MQEKRNKNKERKKKHSFHKQTSCRKKFSAEFQGGIQTETI